MKWQYAFWLHTLMSVTLLSVPEKLKSPKTHLLLSDCPNPIQVMFTLHSRHSYNNRYKQHGCDPLMHLYTAALFGFVFI